MENIRVREIGVADIKKAEDFLFKMVEKLFDAEKSKLHHQDIFYLEDTYIKNERNLLLGAFTADNKLIGTIGIKRFVDRFPVLENRYLEDKTCEIVRCYLDDDYRRRGIGSLLLEELLAKIGRLGYDRVYLHTHRHLPGGFDFWLKKGFVITVEDTDIHKTVHMELKI